MRTHTNFWFVVVFAQSVTALKFTTIQMPALVQRGTNFWLACVHEQESDEQLYSVKWYKNNEEFYRLLAADQQRQFSVPGVNVMMSQSNSTHVRLLNASLESDGSYACEISTQNLSTIRHEREIRIYGLPANAKLQLSGLKSRYSFGERAELHCSSDSARPAGSIGWFINGRQVIAASYNSSARLEMYTRTMAPNSTTSNDEPQRVRSVLKFKFGPELLDGLVSLSPEQPLNGNGNDNQSWPIAVSKRGTLPLLNIECKYKLTEVSEVTFSELLVGQSSRKRERRRPKMVHNNDDHDNQHHFGIARMQANISGACKLGALALDRDDPAIIIPNERASEDNNSDDENDENSVELWRAGERAPIAELRGPVLHVDCATMAELSSAQVSSQAAVVPVLHLQHNSLALCNDTQQLKRMLISGKYQQAVSASQQRPPLFAYLALDGNQLARVRSLAGTLSLSPANRGTSNNNNNNNEHRPVATNLARRQALAPPLLEWFINNQEAPDSSVKYWPELPLVSPSAGSIGLGTQQHQRRLVSSSIDGAQLPADILPTINYQEYFANFINRPIEQRVGLDLKLDKHHFETPDSKLRLRCSSTKAQVLASESVSVTIYAIAESDNVADEPIVSGGWQQRSASTSKYFSHSAPGQARARQQARDSTLQNGAVKRHHFSATTTNKSNSSVDTTHFSGHSSFLIFACLLLVLTHMISAHIVRIQ